MHGLTQEVVAPECEGEVAYAAADAGVGQMFVYPPRGAYEVQRIGVVLLHSGGYGEHVGVEDYVPRVESRLLGEQTVGAGAYLDLAFECDGLPLLVECHHDKCGAEFTHAAGALEECLLTLLERQ